MAAVLIDQQTASATGTTSVTLTLGSNTSAGDTILLSIIENHSGATRISSVTMPGATFNSIAATAGNAGGGGTTFNGMWIADNVGAQTTPTITVAKSSTGTMVVTMFHYSGLSPSALDQATRNVGSASPLTTGTTATLSQPNEIVVASCGVDNGAFTSVTVGAGYGNLIQLLDSALAAQEDQTVAATTAVSGSFTGVGTAGGWSAMIATLRIINTITANTGSNNWNTNGAWVGAVQPTAADDVIVPSGATVTIPAATTVVCRSLTVQSGGTLIFAATTSILSIGDSGAPAGLSALNISSGSTITLTGIGTINYISTSTAQQTITTGGKTLPNETFNGAGSSYLLADSHTMSGGITTSVCTFNTGNQTINASFFNVGSGAGARNISFGSSAISLSSTGSAFSCLSTSGLTFNSNTAVVTLTGNMISANSLILIGFNWNGLSFVLNGGGVPTISTGGGAIIGSLTLTGTANKANVYTFSNTLTINGTFTVAGNTAANRVLVSGLTPGTAVTITCANAPTLSNVEFMDITAAGAGGTWSGTYIGDCLGNTNITFTRQAGGTNNSGTGVNMYWIGNLGTGDVGTNWSFSNGGSAANTIPLPQDDTFYTASSFNGTNQRVQLNMPRTCRNMDTTGCNQTGTTIGSASGTNIGFFGNVTYAGTAKDDPNASGQVTYYGRSSLTMTNNGNLRYGAQVFQAPGGTYTIQDDYQTTNSNNKGISFNYGTFDANGHNLGWQTYTTASSFTLVKMGSGTWQIVIAAGGQAWTFSAAAAVLQCQTSTINFSNATSAARTFSGGSAVYNVVNLQNNGSTGAMTITGNNYFDTLTFQDTTNARTLTLTSGSINTVRNFNVVGTSGKLITINSSAGGTAAYLELIGAPSVVDFQTVTDIFSTLPYKYYAGVNSTTTGVTTNVLTTAIVTGPSIYRQAENTGTTTSLVGTFPFSMSATAGRLLLATYTATANPGVVTTPSGYTAINNNSQGTTAYCYTWYKVASGGETNVTVATGNSVAGVVKLYEVDGFVGRPTLDVTDSSSTAGAASLSTSGANPSNTTNPAIAIAVWGGATAMGATSSFSNSFEEQREVTQITTARWAAKLLTTNAAVNTTNTWTNSVAAVSQLMVFKGVLSQGNFLMFM